MWPELDGRRTRKTDHAVLGGDIGRGERKTGFRRLAADVDDATAASLRDHALSGMLDAEERPAQVHTEHRIPVGLSELHRRLHEVADAGVVDHDVERTVAGDSLVDQSLDLRLLQHITGDPDRLAAGCADPLDDPVDALAATDRTGGHLGAACRPDVAHHDLAAFGCQPPRHGLPEPLRPPCASDDGDFSVQVCIGSHRCSFSGYSGLPVSDTVLIP